MSDKSIKKPKYLPKDIDDFETMIQGNYVYVDKTQIIYNLFSRGARYYFLSRPRRFGKTLLISTLKQLFMGKKDLFKDQWIYNSDYDWTEYPVIHLDFSKIAHRSPELLEKSIKHTLNNIAQKYGIALEANVLEDAFTSLIEKLAERNKVVILIDEYDYALLSHLNDIELAKKNREILKSLYGVLKGMGPYLRSIFITGVTKFSKTSIFSGLNNLDDITLDPMASSLLGYTQKELETYFSDNISDVALANHTETSEILTTMKTWYNGYRFSSEDIKVYNPFSILYYFEKKKLKNFWFESGTPFFLVHLLKQNYSLIESLKFAEFSTTGIGTIDIDDIPLITLLFQTGYLTIIDYNRTTDKYKLGYPNTEIEQSLQTYLVSALANQNVPIIEQTTSQLAHALKENDLNLFCKLLRSLLAQIPYNLHIPQERYYHSLFQIIGSLLGLNIQSEVSTDKGRVDLVLTTKTHIYIFELKFNSDAQTALKQIEEQKYYERYLLSKKQIVLVGLAFKQEDSKMKLECISKTLKS